jgi:hypothetical protein
MCALAYIPNFDHFTELTTFITVNTWSKEMQHWHVPYFRNYLDKETQSHKKQE